LNLAPARLMEPHILHLIPSLVVGGAQRTVATLRRTPGLESRVEVIDRHLASSIAWSDVVVLHAWRTRPDSLALNVPTRLKEITERPIILFNHDWEGSYDGVADLILVYSAFAAAHWIGSQPVTVLPGGITLDRFSTVARLRSWSTVATVGRLSTLHPGKISPQTLECWPRLDAKLFLVGGGGSQLPSLVEASTDPRFWFVGDISPPLTHEFLARVDIFLYDTDWHVESFCYAVLEALAAGCVVVASCRGAISELVEDGANGFLFHDPDESVMLCNRLLRDPESCRGISRAGVATANRFPAELMRSRFGASVNRVLRERPR
jgi:glycosyltransferase involved in cell wall biosynthesis